MASATGGAEDGGGGVRAEGSACARNGLVGRVHMKSSLREKLALSRVWYLGVRVVDLLSKVVIVGIHISRASDVPARRKGNLVLRSL